MLFQKEEKKKIENKMMKKNNGKFLYLFSRLKKNKLISKFILLSI